MIGVGTTGDPALPPPNRTCGSPAYGSPVGGSPPSGLTGRSVGCGKEEQPPIGKVGIGPLDMVKTPTSACTSTTAPEYAAQAHAYPRVEASEGRGVAMFEVLKPATEGQVDVRDNHGKAVTVITLRLGAQSRFLVHKTIGGRTDNPNSRSRLERYNRQYGYSQGAG
jgi:hypothetical protein